jgi:hypothetical protein
MFLHALALGLIKQQPIHQMVHNNGDMEVVRVEANQDVSTFRRTIQML